MTGKEFSALLLYESHQMCGDWRGQEELWAGSYHQDEPRGAETAPCGDCGNLDFNQRIAQREEEEAEVAENGVKDLILTQASVWKQNFL